MLNFSLKAPVWRTGSSLEEWNETTLQKFEEKRLEDGCLAGGSFLTSKGSLGLVENPMDVRIDPQQGTVLKSYICSSNFSCEFGE